MGFNEIDPWESALGGSEGTAVFVTFASFVSVEAAVWGWPIM